MEENPLQYTNFVGNDVTNPAAQASNITTLIAHETDYVLVKTGRQIDNTFSPANYEVLIGLSSLFQIYPLLHDYFEKEKTFWIYQDSSTVTVYRKVKQIPQSEEENIQNTLEQIFTNLHQNHKGK